MEKPNISQLVRAGKSSEEIQEAFEDYSRFLIEQEREAIRLAERAEKSAQYFANKEAHGSNCLTCGCKLAVSTTSGYCRKHVTKAVLGKEESEKAPKIKYIKYKTFYGVRGDDLMDHKYYQGGACSPR